VSLGQEERTLIEQAIREHCVHKNWEVVAINVRSNHVHAIIAAPETHSPEQVLTQLKAWSTRALRSAGYAQQHQRVWTRHGSTRYLWTQEQLYRAATYVAEHQ
jgi:REP element-mobilizing transposase RayT